MVDELNLDFILNLYKKYSSDLKEIRRYQRELLSKKGKSRFEKFILFRGIRYLSRKLGLSNSLLMNINPQLDDLESEITYLLIREFKPKNIVEISPCGGWSTTWILNALKDNGFGRLYSYDLVDDSTKVIPKELSKGRWVFIKGDIKRNKKKLPANIDYLFIDAEHTKEFSKWYTKELFPLLRKDILVSVHDVFHTNDPSGKYTEGKVVIDWLKQKKINYFTSSREKENKIHNNILSLRRGLGFGEKIIQTEANSMIFFKT